MHFPEESSFFLQNRFYYDLLGLLHTNSTPICPDMTMKVEISAFILANSITDIATASVFVFSGYYQWSLLF